MSDDYHQMAAECGVPISSERVMHHLRCLSVDCEWQAFEVEQYIKQLERDRDVIAAEVEALRHNERVVEETFPGQEQRFVARMAVRQAKERTDASGALQRAKEVK